MSAPNPSDGDRELREIARSCEREHADHLLNVWRNHGYGLEGLEVQRATRAFRKVRKARKRIERAIRLTGPRSA